MSGEGNRQSAIRRINVRESPINLFIGRACFRNGTAAPTMCCLQVMPRRYLQREENGLATALYVVGCMCVCGLFVFGFCKMFEPRHIHNLGLAAYKPFPATVVDYRPSAHTLIDMPEKPEIPETSGQATEVVATPFSDPVRPEHAKHTATVERRARAARVREPGSRRAERSVSSSAHAQFHSLRAAFPGYAMLH
jgi:hypothetical protein